LRRQAYATMPQTENTLVSAIWGATFATGILMLIFVGMRVYSRQLVKSSLGLDDWLMVAAAVIAVAFDANTIIATYYGSGYHLEDIDPAWSVPFAKVNPHPSWKRLPIPTILTSTRSVWQTLRSFQWQAR
jgi:hypothetical protein